jgi:hypothetical protein
MKLKLSPVDRILAEVRYLDSGPKWTHKVFDRDIDRYGSEINRPDKGSLPWRGLVWVALMREGLSVRMKRLRYRVRRST